MKNIFVGCGLFILQIYFTFLGVSNFHKYFNPILLFAISMAIPAYLIWLYLGQTSLPFKEKVLQPLRRGFWAIGGLLVGFVAYEEFRKACVKFSEPEKWSDVLPQMNALYERFSHGEFPYNVVELVGYSPMPVYMPFHWLPIGLAAPLHLDIRLIGFGFFVLSIAIYGWFLAVQTDSTLTRMLALILPTLPLWAFIRWGELDIMVSYEMVIGAYYLLLSTGLFGRRLWLVAIGIILCVLSRYTLIFWLPLFAIILFFEKGWKKSLWVWGALVVSILLFYIIPFYMRDPSIFTRGLAYYTGATIAEWQGYGDPPVSYSMESGISFGAHMKALFRGDMAHRVHLARMVQGTILLSLLVGGWLSYRRWRHRIDFYTFSLIGLYLFVSAYYFFGPLTYRYYYFPLLVLSSVLCGKIIIHGNNPPVKLDA